MVFHHVVVEEDGNRWNDVVLLIVHVQTRNRIASLDPIFWLRLMQMAKHSLPDFHVAVCYMKIPYTFYNSCPEFHRMPPIIISFSLFKNNMINSSPTAISNLRISNTLLWFKPHLTRMHDPHVMWKSVFNSKLILPPASCTLLSIPANLYTHHLIPHLLNFGNFLIPPEGYIW